MKALIIDDHPVFISALESLLQRMHQSIHIDTATSADLALHQIEFQQDYQLILLDLSMPGLDGFSFLRALQQRNLPIPVVIVSSSEEAETIHACISAGAAGYIPKSHDLEQMASALECIYAGDIYLPEALLQTEYQTDAEEILRRCKQIGIGEKTYQVLIWLAKGKTNKEIADELNISVHTVKAHLAKLFDRLQTSNRMDTVMEAIRLGLIDG